MKNNTNNNLELIYKFAKKHRLLFHYCEDFENNIVNAFIVVGESVLDYVFYSDSDSERISLCGEVRTELGMETALRYFEDEMLLKGEL